MYLTAERLEELVFISQISALHSSLTEAFTCNQTGLMILRFPILILATRGCLCPPVVARSPVWILTERRKVSDHVFNLSSQRKVSVTKYLLWMFLKNGRGSGIRSSTLRSVAARLRSAENARTKSYWMLIRCGPESARNSSRFPGFALWARDNLLISWCTQMLPIQLNEERKGGLVFSIVEI